MTKYVVNSGSVRKYPDKARKFFSEIIKGLDSNPKILICMFAQPREEWERKFKEDLIIYKMFFENSISPSFDLALPDTFQEQVQKSDVIYIQGGDDSLIQYWLKKYDLPKLWEGKVIATSSASSHALSKYFWTCDWRQCMEGLGILPIKFIAHFKSDYGSQDPRGSINWDQAYEELKEYGNQDLPIYALQEGDFEIFEI